jgi:hypothetical protein
MQPSLGVDVPPGRGTSFHTEIRSRGGAQIALRSVPGKPPRSPVLGEGQGFISDNRNQTRKENVIAMDTAHPWPTKHACKQPKPSSSPQVCKSSTQPHASARNAQANLSENGADLVSAERQKQHTTVCAET